MSLVLQAIHRWAAERPHAEALTGAGAAWSWSRLEAEIRRVAAELANRLPLKGHAAVELPNGPAWVITDLALVSLGRASVPIPPFFTTAQREAVYADAGVSSVITAGNDLFIGAEGVAVDAVNSWPVALHPGTAKVTYTSGSTGAPKGVCLSQAQMESVATSLVSLLGEAFAGVHLPVLPLAVLLENVAGLYASLMAGGTYHAAPAPETGMADPFRPDFAALAGVIKSARITSLILVPELLRGLIAARNAGAEFASLRLVAVGGAKVSPALLEAAARSGLPVVEGYGLSECASVVALNRPGAGRPGSVGQSLPHLSVMIGQDRQIVVSPPGFLGYVGGPRQTEPLKTGDLGRLDADGYLYVDGRASNILINSFGRNVSPEWVESELLAQPQIAQAMVFGEAQPALGALIVPMTASVDAKAIAEAVAAANARLPSYAHIARWLIVPPFDPHKGQLTGNGRPRRAVLVAEYADFIGAAEEAA